jgi:hypothetical protein
MATLTKATLAAAFVEILAEMGVTSSIPDGSCPTLADVFPKAFDVTEFMMVAKAIIVDKNGWSLETDPPSTTAETTICDLFTWLKSAVAS